MTTRLTDNARSALRAAFRGLACAPERAVVAALASGRGAASAMLRDTGVSLERLPDAPVERRRLLDDAVREARARGDGHVGTEHLLLAIARPPGSGLAAQGVSVGRLGESLAAATAEWQSRPGPLVRLVARLRSAFRGK